MTSAVRCHRNTVMIIELTAMTIVQGLVFRSHRLTGSFKSIAAPTSQHVRAMRQTLGGSLLETLPSVTPTMLGE